MIVSIDPGLTGGIANLSEEDGLWLEPMPRNESGIDAQELYRLVKEMKGAKAAYVESIYAVPSSGAHSMMVFGKTYGVVIGILTAVGIPIIEVRSQQWMKEIYKGCPENLVKKERSVWAFNKLFPGINANEPGKKRVHMGMLEAALIAEYGRRQ